MSLVNRERRDMRNQEFKKKVWEYYYGHCRSLPWRKTRNPYRIVVSEIMLQQTHVDRVIDKYKEFINIFPDFSVLGRASLREILRVWQGLGYNRRALYLKQIARIITQEYNGRMPHDPSLLKALPGIGNATASAIAAFAFNKPVVFLETNIRALFIHSFFNDRADVSDREILPLVEKTLDASNPRQWYYALMDYGALIKKQYRNPSTKSAHYTKQSPFKGSNRELRGLILKQLVEHKSLMPIGDLVARVGKDREKILKNLDNLVREGFVKRDKRSVMIQ